MSFKVKEQLLWEGYTKKTKTSVHQMPNSQWNKDYFYSALHVVITGL